ncbi:unnamed protein product [Lactuca virosa]|uniref:Uncharacterized protein n=1 Tax=Lactuca virosa TaxID=75947 RepID=A0AAU9MGX8_9ASTR|nr:unnamed protein product [Lactuca virosa]
MEEDETSNINEILLLFHYHHLLHHHYGGSTTAIDTSTVPLPPPTSPPQPSTILPTSTSTVSPTFEKVMQEPITILFSSQSTDAEKTIHEEEINDDDVMVSFVDLEFNPNEDDVPDEAIMSGKQFKIFNSKMNSIFQFLNDRTGKSSVSSSEVKFLLKS